MFDLKECLDELDKSRAAYQAIANTASAIEIRPHTERIKRLHAAASIAICEGAQLCPRCGGNVHGIIHDGGKRGPEFQICCLACPKIEDPEEPSKFILPQGHRSASRVAAVAAWNEGPSAWERKDRSFYE